MPFPTESHVGYIPVLHFLTRRACNTAQPPLPMSHSGLLHRYRCPTHAFTPQYHVRATAPPSTLATVRLPSPQEWTTGEARSKDRGVSRAQLTGSPVQGQRGNVRLLVGPQGDITHSQRRRIGCRSVVLGVGSFADGELDATAGCVVAKERGARNSPLGIGSRAQWSCSGAGRPCLVLGCMGLRQQVICSCDPTPCANPLIGGPPGCV